MPNRPDGIWEVTAYFLTCCVKDGIYVQICGFMDFCVFNEPPRTGAQRNLVATYACNDHYDESSLGYQLTFISPAYCYQMSLPLLSSVDGEENYRVSFLVFFHIVSHSYIILPQNIVQVILTRVSMQNLNNQNPTRISLNVPSQVCLWNYKEKWPQFKSLIRLK